MKRGKVRNFIPRLLSSIICLLLLASLVYFFSPEGFFAVVTFFILLFLGSLFISSLMWNHLRRSFFTALFVVIYFGFRFYGVGTILNAALLLGFFATVEIYMTRYR